MTNKNILNLDNFNENLISYSFYESYLSNNEEMIVKILYNDHEFKFETPIMHCQYYDNNNKLVIIDTAMSTKNQNIFNNWINHLEEKLIEDTENNSQEWFGNNFENISDYDFFNEHYISLIDSNNLLSLKLSDHIQIFNKDKNLIYPSYDINIDELLSNKDIKCIFNFIGIKYSKHKFCILIEISQIIINCNDLFLSEECLINITEDEYSILSSGYDSNYLPDEEEEEEDENDHLTDKQLEELEYHSQELINNEINYDSDKFKNIDLNLWQDFKLAYLTDQELLDHVKEEYSDEVDESQGEGEGEGESEEGEGSDEGEGESEEGEGESEEGEGSDEGEGEVEGEGEDLVEEEDLKDEQEEQSLTETQNNIVKIEEGIDIIEEQNQNNDCNNYKKRKRNDNNQFDHLNLKYDQEIDVDQNYEEDIEDPNDPDYRE